ncbi:respiratory nitrate reductase subunit gamma [Hoyosella rhizosphaerae]|uniref:Nitrate reductase-like protein NarX n=1 Tax=Hoyosella rhizosphaerae TaxID=1755582 RepID=A0A916U226_9ACTN|nr:respiratory nitrate reductase subunit gamma [Hoyosella rhizosphaerae]MBN4926763.1 respiratory nitrate reductase subunit gamma [Hoyosella rhizosphaerae]GGC56674.1 nitrate reductase subunit gamma [Hoyosella rhizosphaerae]
MNTLLWLILPYIALMSFALGHIWRYRHDQFGWTTRSSQMYESRLLQIASPLFHFGLLAVIGGHIGGLGIPKSWTQAVGISDHTYHYLAVIPGTLAGLAVVTGLSILLYRRITVSAIRKATTKGDVVMYTVLSITILTGMMNTIGVNIFGGGYDYRETVSPWFRSVFALSPNPELMVGIPPSFALHAIAALVLFTIWPYTRLVHVFSAPVGYLFRPYVVYRSKDVSKRGSSPYDKAWESANGLDVRAKK